MHPRQQQKQRTAAKALKIVRRTEVCLYCKQVMHSFQQKIQGSTYWVVDPDTDSTLVTSRCLQAKQSTGAGADCSACSGNAFG